MANDAVDTISKYGDFEWFVSDDIPPWKLPCRNEQYQNCTECPNLYFDGLHTDCKLGYDISDLIAKESLSDESKKSAE